jgi:hypothetical protein
MQMHPAAADRSPGDPWRETALERRALALWPRLERRALRRCRHDEGCIAGVVSRRTALPIESIRLLLVMPAVAEHEGSTWFG